MEKHRQIVEPKFKTVLSDFDKELGDYEKLAHWTKPNGGYFISFTRRGRCQAHRAVMQRGGSRFDGSRAAYPYGIDPMTPIFVLSDISTVGGVETATHLCVWQ